MGEGCEICCSFSDALDRLTVTDDIGAEFIGANELALTEGCVGITMAVATLDAVLFVDPDVKFGNGVGVTVTPERFTGLFVEAVDVAEAGIKVIDGEDEKLTMLGW